MPDAPSADFPGIKVYPSYGFDFGGVPGRDLGQIPINGEFVYSRNLFFSELDDPFQF